MRIVFDLQGAQSASRIRGIGRHTMSLAKALVRNGKQHEFFIALNGLFPDTIMPIRRAFEGLVPQINIRVWFAPGPISFNDPENIQRRQNAECIREHFLASLQPDIVHVFSVFEGYGDDAIISINKYTQLLTSITLHDLIPLLNPEINQAPFQEECYLKNLTNVFQANLCCAVSNSAREEAIIHLGLPEKNVINISNATDIPIPSKIDIDSLTEKTLLKHKIGKKFICYCGGFAPHKNVNNLINAFALLPDFVIKNYQLVLIGKCNITVENHLKSLSAEYNLPSSCLQMPGYVPDNELCKLYAACDCFVYPSLHEGSGFPPLEAMSCGAPVIASNATSILEVVGLEEALFDPTSPAAIAQKMEQVLTDESFRQKLIKHGAEQKNTFSWDKTAQVSLKAFEKLCASKIAHIGVVQAETLLPKSAFPYLYSRKFENNFYTKVLQQLDIPSTHFLLTELAECIAQSFPTKHATYQLFVDISDLAQRDAKTGIQRVTRSILAELLLKPPPNYRIEPVYATIESCGYLYARKFISKLFGISPDWAEDTPIEAQNGDIFLGLDLQPSITIAQQDHLFDMQRRGILVCYVLYDILPIQFPSAFPKESKQSHVDYLNLISNFDIFLCISHAVAEHVQEWFNANYTNQHVYPEIAYFHLGCDLENSFPTPGIPSNADKILHKILTTPSICMVSTVEPRKGHAQTLDALEILWQSGYDYTLVIVGKQGWQVEELCARLRNHPELGKRLFWLEGISDEYLEAVYKNCTVALMASIGEGFGLMLIEAARYHKPLIARDIPVFREVAGEHAYYFSGTKGSDLAEALQNWFTLYHAGKAPTTNDMKILTWKESTQMLCDALFLHAHRDKQIGTQSDVKN